MSRAIILGLADGTLDQRDPGFAAFIRRLGGEVAPFRQEWLALLGGSAAAADGSPGGWQTRAALDLLGHLCGPGPEGGKPPAQAVAAGMLSKERQADAALSDDDWMNYFLKAIRREQKRYLQAALGTGGGGELRRRLMAALKQPGVTAVDDYFYGPDGAKAMGIDVPGAVRLIGQRAVGGESAHHEGGMPTVGEIKRLVAEVCEALPNHAPSFPNWLAIVAGVFEVGLRSLPPGSGGDDDDDGLPWEPAVPGGAEAIVNGADEVGAVECIKSLIAALDGQPFPTGVHGRTFVEYFLFHERAGALRVTQSDYAVRTGVSDSTVANRLTAIFQALRDGNLRDCGDDAICGAFRRLAEEFLARHLEVFPG